MPVNRKSKNVNRLKIGFDAKRLFNNRTGLGNYSRTLLDNLRRFQPDNEYVLFTPKVSENEFGEKYAKEFPTVTPEKMSGTYWRSYGVGKDIEKEGIEVFHGLSNELPFRLEGVKKVVTIHDLIFKRLPDTYPFLDRQVYDLKSRKSCRNADVVIAISESTKRDIIHYYGIKEQKIKVIYQACDAIYYEDTAVDKKILKKYNLPKNYLLSVGSIVERKNLLNTIKAIAELPKDLQIPLVVVGKGKKYRQKVMSFLHSNRMESQIIWIENLTDIAELKQVYQNATTLLYPSEYEGFGLPVVEGLLCKTPVITSNISSLPEAAGDGALLVNPRSIEEIAGAMEKLLTDEVFAGEIVEKGYRYARKTFDAQRLTKELVEVYKM
ncbi:MAG: glycosyltransferase involved in cell wall biosynthesis [Saprospiraceae bacterium]